MWNNRVPYTAPVCSAFFAHEVNFPRSLFSGYSKCYKNAGKNQSPYYLHALKLITQQDNVSTRTVLGGKHLAPLMLAAKLPLTPMGGGRHPRAPSAWCQVLRKQQYCAVVEIVHQHSTLPGVVKAVPMSLLGIFPCIFSSPFIISKICWVKGGVPLVWVTKVRKTWSFLLVK